MPIESLTPDDLGVNVEPRFEVLSVDDPPTRAGGVKVKSVDELVTKLRADGVL
jgi:electron transfer flavoprotein beta subunit